MKTLLTTLFILIFAELSSAQTIGSSFADLKQSYPDGKFELNDNKDAYHYIVDAKNNQTVYLLDFDLIIIAIIICPLTDDMRQSWIETVNKSWISVSNTEWKYYRDNGMVMSMKMKTLSSGVVFVINQVY